MELSYTAGKNIKWYNHFGKRFGSFLKSEIYAYYMFQLVHSPVLTQEKRKNPITQGAIHQCLEHLYL